MNIGILEVIENRLTAVLSTYVTFRETFDVFYLSGAHVFTIFTDTERLSARCKQRLSNDCMNIWYETFVIAADGGVCYRF